jgi:hypothetical protein
MIRPIAVCLALGLTGFALGQTPTGATATPPHPSGAASSVKASGAAKGSTIVAVNLPDSGSYLLLAEDASRKPLAPPNRVNGPKAAEELPAGAAKGPVLLSVLNEKSRLLARKTLKPGETAASLTFKNADFDRIAALPLRVMSGGKAVSAALVSLVGPDGQTVGEEQLLPGMGGIAEFKSVPAGKNTVKVVYNDGQTATQEIDVDPSLSPGERHAEVTVADAKSTEPPKAFSGEAAGAESGTAKKPAAPAPSPAPESASNSLLDFVVALGVMALLFFGGWTYFKNRPDAVKNLLSRLPLPDEETEPLRSAEPPPVQVAPGACEFCGERKDPLTGACACALPNGADRAVSAPVTPFGGSEAFVSGPRLVGVSGLAAGRTFPLRNGEMTLGRESGNDIPLSEDPMVSRRHARLIQTNGAYTARDEDSSNGTFLNGARITEATLHSGDELTVGQSRFRFEE